MNQWTKTRKCQDCGRIFNLSDHNNEDAFATAYALEWDQGFDKKINYIYSIKCPECYSRIIEDFKKNEAMRQANKKWWQIWK